MEVVGALVTVGHLSDHRLWHLHSEADDSLTVYVREREQFLKRQAMINFIR